MRGPAGEPITGILNIDKPQGHTSHDVVARVRRIADQRRVGHAGTLDPMATGVLVVCLGKATRVVDYVADGLKAYRATVRFGAVTDTWDAEGRVLSQQPWDGLGLSEVEQALSAFVGRIEQVPPMYSALKFHGQPLYRLARQGVTVAREPRIVEIQRVGLLNWRPPDLEIEVVCSKGTYVRSLAHDLGQRLGPGAHLASLTRTAVGPFCLKEAVSLDTLASGQADGSWREHLRPIEAALCHLPRVTVDADTAKRLAYGQGVSLSAPAAPRLCAYDDQGRLVAILRPDEALWRPHKVFVSDAQPPTGPV